MIPASIATFLEGATVGYGATRNEALVPQIHRLQAWKLGDAPGTVVCIFGTDLDESLIPSLEDNGLFSFTLLGSLSGPKASKPPNPAVDFNECYQFKGEFVGSRAANEEDVPLVRQKGELFKALFQPIFGFSDRVCDARFGKPVLAVTIRVREIYDQTPGPGAGMRIHPEKAS